ncbi:venom protein 164-like [Haliotis cracherodii]|uniref:venom protein 164-like n=1 Tax=Haliotis cracherodii TaxID=6455 RepID=UPI0039EAE1D8
MASFVLLLAASCLALVYGQNTTSCSTATQCPSYMCCQQVKAWPQGPIGKRALGECRPIRTQGQSCWVKNRPLDGTRPLQVMDECPCESGLRCVGIGATVVPYGEAGNCAM